MEAGHLFFQVCIQPAQFAPSSQHNVATTDPGGGQRRCHVHDRRRVRRYEGCRYDIGVLGAVQQNVLVGGDQHGVIVSFKVTGRMDTLFSWRHTRSLP